MALSIMDNERLRRLLDEERTSRQKIERENRRLRRTLSALKEELEITRRDLRAREKMVTHTYDRLHEAGLTDPLKFPVSEEAIWLFEALPTTFTLDDVFDACDELEVATTLGTRHLKTYLDERMIELDETQEPTRYFKTGRQPYF